jgi:hypothetical protein
MLPRPTATALKALFVTAALTAAVGVGSASAHAATTPTASANAAIHDGSAPQCIHTSVGTDGWAWDTQTALNTCDQSYRVKLVWAVAQGDCQTLNPGDSMTYEVLKPAWAQGADLC